jgi:hypothetical protein
MPTLGNVTLFLSSFFRFALLAQVVIGKHSRCVLWTGADEVNCAHYRWSFNFLVRSEQMKVFCRLLSVGEEVLIARWRLLKPSQRSCGWGRLRGQEERL